MTVKGKTGGRVWSIISRFLKDKASMNDYLDIKAMQTRKKRRKRVRGNKEEKGGDTIVSSPQHLRRQERVGKEEEE